MAETLAQAEAALRMMKADFQRSGAGLKRLRQEVRREQNQISSIWYFNPYVVAVLLLLYYLGNYSSVFSVAYVQCLAKKKKWPERSDEEILDVVQRLFLSVDATTFAELTSDEASEVYTYRRAQQAARKFKAEYEAVIWTKDANARKGLAPGSDVILFRLVRASEQEPADLTSPLCHFLDATSSGRVYMHRWRKQYGGRYGSVRPIANLSSEQVSTKVPPLDSPHCTGFEN